MPRAFLRAGKSILSERIGLAPALFQGSDRSAPELFNTACGYECTGLLFVSFVAEQRNANFFVLTKRQMNVYSLESGPTNYINSVCEGLVDAAGGGRGI